MKIMFNKRQMKIYPELLFKIQNPEHVDSPAKTGQVIQPLKQILK
jgi:hypothetical protein